MTWNREALESQRSEILKRLRTNQSLRNSAESYLRETYSEDQNYLWDWLGFPILQMPEDIVVFQEIIQRCRPTVVVETGIAWGGSIALSASILSLANGSGRVIAVDLNLDASLDRRLGELNLPVEIALLRGDSTAPEVLERVRQLIEPDDRVMVSLDSHHTHEHVLRELELYSELVTVGQYLIVGDTSVRFLADATRRERPWSRESNPHSAMLEFLAKREDFEVDDNVNSKLLLTFHPGGYLVRKTEEES
jgi:cephalosporin hydroxylase